MTNDTKTPPGRFPGKYIAIGLIVLVAVMFMFALILSIRLGPAADRFHNGESVPQRK